MMSALPAGHPKRTLFFFIVADVESDLVQNIKAGMKNLIHGLADATSWILGPPCFIEDREEPEEAGELAFETVGGYLHLYTALPPWSLPRDVDLQHRNEVETLVTRLCDFSRHAQLEIEFELDGMYVGSIKSGEMDDCLSIGLLGEWRRLLYL